MWEFETQERAAGRTLLCGVDEAGRGPLAGPVCAAAVILPFEVEIPGLNDSKKLSEARRERLFPEIQEKALAFSIAFAQVEEIEEYNILGATMRAMQRAVKGLNITPELVLVDGNRAPDFGIPARTIVKGDARSASIAAASILAKVSRDRLMRELDAKYPQYGFAKHKGYGTAAHYAALQEYGLCPEHRPSFLKNLAAHAGNGNT